MYLSSVVVGLTVSRYTTTTATSALAARRRSARCENNLGADVALRQDLSDRSRPFSPRCGLSPPLGWPETPDALRQLHPSPAMVSGFISSSSDCPHDHDDHALIKDETAKPQVPFHTVYMTGLIRDDEGCEDVQIQG